MGTADPAKSGDRHAFGAKLRLLGRSHPTDRAAECGRVIERLVNSLCIRHHEAPLLGDNVQSCSQVGKVTPGLVRRQQPSGCWGGEWRRDRTTQEKKGAARKRRHRLSTAWRRYQPYACPPDSLRRRHIKKPSRPRPTPNKPSSAGSGTAVAVLPISEPLPSIG